MSWRTFLLKLFFLFFSSQIVLASYHVFEKDGRYGIKDELGEVLIPAVYDRLGWSDRSQEIIDGIIGYQERDSWGLINIKNKKLTDRLYYSISYLENGLIKAAIKGPLSNQLFYGMIDSKGKTIISFNYSDLQLNDKYVIASKYDYGVTLTGLLSRRNEVIIPFKYQSIINNNQLFIATYPAGSKDIFDAGFNSIAESVDSIKYYSDHVQLYKKGLQGAFKIEPFNRLFEIAYKSIENISGTIVAKPYPKWTIYQSTQKMFEWECDSIKKLENGLWLCYLNNTTRLIHPDQQALDYYKYELKDVSENYIVVQSIDSKKWEVLNKNGKILISKCDSIINNPEGFFIKNNNEWVLHNKYGTKLSSGYDAMVPGLKKQVLIKKGGYWGIIDYLGNKITNFKYDSIAICKHHYKVKFIQAWGLIDKYGNWVINPEYKSVEYISGNFYAQRGFSYHIYKGKELLFRTANRPHSWFSNGMIVQLDNGHFQLYNSLGEIIDFEEYDEVKTYNNLIEFKKEGKVSLRSMSGREIISLNDEVTQIGTIKGARIPIKKNSKWGFVDMNGRLRIANRYDSVMSFSEQMAPIKLRGKWGVIDIEERLIAQPYYDQISDFENGNAIVSQKGKYGLINKEGETVVGLQYKRITRNNLGNYYCLTFDDKVGLLTDKGNFILNADYDQIIDFGAIVIQVNEKYGVLSKNGKYLFDTIYDDAVVLDGLIAVKINQEKRSN